MTGMLKSLLSPIPVEIASLPLGSAFVVAGCPELRGYVVRANECRVRVRLIGETRFVEFTDKSQGKDAEKKVGFEVVAGRYSDWSTATPVFPGGDMGDTASLAASAQEEDGVAKTKTVKAPKAKAEKKEKAVVTLKPCGCGCGEKVTRTFRPGHDARYYGWLKRVANGKMGYSELAKFVRLQLKDVAAVKAALKAHYKKSA